MSKVSEKLVEEKGVKHPLAGLLPVSFQSFDEWLVRWSSTKVLGERLGLLHCIQTMNYWPETREQTVFYLLDIANGYQTGNPFRYRNSWYCNEVNAALEAIAKKAFDVLCVKLFAPGKENDPPLWWWMLEKQETFDKLLQFCDPEAKNYRVPWDGKEPDHQTEVFGNFMREFCQLGWTYSRRSDSRSENELEVRERVIAARPKFIEILRHIRELNWLNKPMGWHGSDFPELDKACLKKLTEIAFMERLYLPRQHYYESDSSRKPKTLHEAVRGGSVAAEILVLHSIRQKETKRINALYQASRRKHEELQRQRELADIERAKKALDQKAAELSG